MTPPRFVITLLIPLVAVLQGQAPVPAQGRGGRAPSFWRTRRWHGRASGNVSCYGSSAQ